MNELIVDLNISADQFLRLYRGEVEDVVTRSRDGRRVRFPAGNLRRFVTREGIRGAFRIRYDAQGKLTEISRL
ncbi:MAG: DUF2835 domain-containing protein [Oceanospirillaceae bacterium]|jgi:YD repeat-containing protein|uniref:DUF2835 domain-containing protein n=1 Tax=Marinobacterium litorale TaxID=404770 RepID=UPI000403380F|nr:DUF2835 domain-containing protein [Marinobacterium litorale]MBS99054.1 DUF2835 domain-containing protein [Oceanospirillaceae bacterium]